MIKSFKNYIYRLRSITLTQNILIIGNYLWFYQISKSILDPTKNILQKINGEKIKKKNLLILNTSEFNDDITKKASYK